MVLDITTVSQAQVAQAVRAAVVVEQVTQELHQAAAQVTQVHTLQPKVCLVVAVTLPHLTAQVVVAVAQVHLVPTVLTM